MAVFRNIIFDQSFGINSDHLSAVTSETPSPGDRFFLKPKSKENTLNIISSIGKTIDEYQEINDQGNLKTKYLITLFLLHLRIYLQST